MNRSERKFDANIIFCLLKEILIAIVVGFNVFVFVGFLLQNIANC
jgi:hypothetical protein